MLGTDVEAIMDQVLHNHIMQVYAIGIPIVKREEDVDSRQEVHHMHNRWRGGVEEGRITELSNEQPHRRMLNDNESRR